jgi:hypothetical protein
MQMSKPAIEIKRHCRLVGKLCTKLPQTLIAAIRLRRP